MARTQTTTKARLVGASLEAALEELEPIPGDELRRLRRAKFRTIGMAKAAAR